MLDYIGEGDFIMIYNSQRMNLRAYHDKSIINESRVMNRQFDKSKPNWQHGQYYNGELKDKTNPWPWGEQTFIRPYRHLNTVGMYPSAWTDFPTKYKITGY
jgi:hypothetical protein